MIIFINSLISRISVAQLDFINDIMNFFNKYKDLFGVSQRTPIPTSKLSINNNLFVDKPFVPTYKQTLSINSKLKDLRKDYNELQQQIQSINNTMRHSRRISSRKGKQIQQNRQTDRLLNNSNNQINSPIPASPKIGNNNSSTFLKHHHRKLIDNTQNRSNSLKQLQKSNLSQEAKDPFQKKRILWLKDQQVNLTKHSEMNYIFNHKIKQQNPRLKNVGQSTIPKAQNFLFGSLQNNSSGMKANEERNQSCRPVNRNRPVQQNSSQLQTGPKRMQSQRKQSDYNGAVRRRQQAKKNIIGRRQKLGYLLRTSW